MRLGWRFRCRFHNVNSVVDVVWFGGAGWGNRFHGDEGRWMEVERTVNCVFHTNNKNVRVEKQTGSTQQREDEVFVEDLDVAERLLQGRLVCVVQTKRCAVVC